MVYSHSKYFSFEIGSKLFLHFFFSAIMQSRIQERKKRRAEESKNATPAQTPLEATRQMLKKKVLFLVNLIGCHCMCL